MKKKWVVAGSLVLLLINGCSISSTKTYPSINLPYEIVNEEVEEIKNEGFEPYTDKQVLKEVNVREITAKENERFLERMKQTTSNDLNQEYSAVEFYFDEITKIDVNEKSFIKFNEKKSNFVYDEELILNDFYQIPIYKEREALLTGETTWNDREISYGNTYKDLKIVVLVKTNVIKKGLQFKTDINNEIVYIDVK